jgi:hypothetical protein
MKNVEKEISGNKKRATTFRIVVTPHTMKHYNLFLNSNELLILSKSKFMSFILNNKGIIIFLKIKG